MSNIKNRIITILCAFLIIKLIGIVLLSNTSWSIQKPLFNYIDHSEVINNVIHFNDITRNSDLSGKIFAFGNSQVRSIFRDEANRQDARFNWSYVGGFRLSAIPYYINYMVSAKPKYVVFYLSDKDFNYSVLFHSLFHHPFPLIEYLKNAPDILKHSDHTTSELIQYALGELISPLKLSYQFKHLIEDNFFLLKNRTKKKVQTIQKPRQKQELPKKTETKKSDKQLETVQENPKKDVPPATLNGINGLLHQRNVKGNPELVEYNFDLLEEAVKKLIKNDIKVIFVEGQYHPLAFDSPKFANEDPHRLVNVLADNYKEISVIKLESQIKLTSDDYMDHIHFTKEAGSRLKATILDALGKLD